MPKLTLNFYLNGRLIKERLKPLEPGHSWLPTIKFKEGENIVILNPFAQAKGVEDELNTNYVPHVSNYQA